MSSHEKLSGSDFINQYCCAAMLFPFRWGARTVKGITSADNGSFRALQISRATFIGRPHKRSPRVSNDSGAGAGAVYEAWRSDERRVGTECVSAGRWRWPPRHNKKNKIDK